MIPPEGELPPGTDREFVEGLRRTLGPLPRLVGTVTLVEDSHILSHRAWEMTPVLIALEFFGLPIDRESYRTVVEQRISEIDAAERPDVLIGPRGRSAIVNVVKNMSVSQIEKILARRQA